MSLPFTSVVSLHTNTFGCGVAKFSAQLAERLRVPFVGLSERTRMGLHPLLSLKWSEVSEPVNITMPYSLFWHDAGSGWHTRHAQHVFYADPSLGSPGLWCPSLITPKTRPVKLFSFGMAHKLQTTHYQRVRELLDAAGKRYHLRVSVGLHEGTDLSDATKHFDALKAILGPENVTILGILSDDAVSEELTNCDYVLAFFEKGLRANNTTVHAAIEHGCRIISNVDEKSPQGFAFSMWDITHLREWPRVGATLDYSWDRLISEMKGVCHEKSRLAQSR